MKFVLDTAVPIGVSLAQIILRCHVGCYLFVSWGVAMVAGVYPQVVWDMNPGVLLHRGGVRNWTGV